MQNKLKHSACILGLGVFLLMAMASEWLVEESTNVSVNLKPSDCEVKPPFTGTLKVTIVNNVVANGVPLDCEIYLSNQKINNNEDCTSFYKYSDIIYKTVNSLTSETITTPSFTHDNKGDLWRVEVRAGFPLTGTWHYKDFNVVFYDQDHVTFTFGSLPKL